MRIFLGSEGAIGIITAAVLRIHRLPDVRGFATHALPQVEGALEAAREVLRRGARPAAMRIYDAEDGLASGLTAAEPGPALLLGTFTGPAEVVECERRILEQAVRERGGTPKDAAPAEKWWRERGGPAAPSTPTADGMRFQVAGPTVRLGAIYRGVRASLLAAGAPSRAFLGHFHEDGGCVYFAFPRSEENDTVAREAAVAAGGGVDAPLAEALRALKARLDPHGILPSGRLS
jgi:alkyldihydroxyacetonephosphate synthase